MIIIFLLFSPFASYILLLSILSNIARTCMGTFFFLHFSVVSSEAMCSFSFLTLLLSQWNDAIVCFLSFSSKLRWQITGLSVLCGVQVECALCFSSQGVWSQSDNLWQFLHFPARAFNGYTPQTQHIISRMQLRQTRLHAWMHTFMPLFPIKGLYSLPLSKDLTNMISMHEA